MMDILLEEPKIGPCVTHCGSKRPSVSRPLCSFEFGWFRSGFNFYADSFVSWLKHTFTNPVRNTTLLAEKSDAVDQLVQSTMNQNDGGLIPGSCWPHVKVSPKVSAAVFSINLRLSFLSFSHLKSHISSKLYL